MMSETPAEAARIVAFWKDAGQDKWFLKDHRFDDAFRSEFNDLHWAAARREFDHWLETPDGALALMILLDQFPRNCFRNTGHMYATDPLARHYARQAVERGHDLATEGPIRVFFYLPFSHSEVLADHDIPMQRSIALGEDYEKHAIGHRDIVARFGRFPHRNTILCRQSTPEEEQFMKEGGFSG
ncbi:DUF924 family protein [Oryzicola mucosus]|uniref:DUF924 family protein n=1 Tax=Oryzicola mucosus TaxID=2767425 RepID=A0A8J6TYM8_9HYPH|nr:DUF924 family protein [Oryzicola mucosus]